MKKPNILFLMCDQMRYDALRFRGCEEIRTPNLDRLFKRSVFFENAFSPNPICVPARASITTGMYPHKCTGCKDNGGEIREEIPKMGEVFARNGYATYAMGKLHYLPYTPPGTPHTGYGFETVEICESGRMVAEFDPDNQKGGVEDYHDYLKNVGWGGFNRGDAMGNNDVFPNTTPIPKEHFVDTWVANRSIAHMDRHMAETPEKPFFMWTSFPKPHSAFDPPRPYDAMYDPRRMSVPKGSIQDIKDRGLAFLANNHTDYMWDKLSVEAMQTIKAHYYGLITLQDEQIGRILNFLENKKILDETIILYTADHGEMLGDFGLYFKANLYNASVRIPLMIACPDQMPSGVVSDALAGLQDVLPTLLSLCGIPVDFPFDGIDLSRAVRGDGVCRDYYVSQCLENEHQQYMVADGAWKYIYHAFGRVEELYDMRTDKSELYNMAAQEFEIVEKYRSILTQWCMENGDGEILENGKLKWYPLREVPLAKNFGGFGRRKY